MYNFSIGVIVDSFRLPIKDAVRKAAEVGAQGIQVYATRGEMAPENMNATKILFCWVTNVDFLHIIILQQK